MLQASRDEFACGFTSPANRGSLSTDKDTGKSFNDYTFYGCLEMYSILLCFFNISYIIKM